MSFPDHVYGLPQDVHNLDEIYEKKAAGRVVTIKCKSCTQGIRVDGTKGAAATAPSASGQRGARARARSRFAPRCGGRSGGSRGALLWAGRLPRRARS